MPSCFGETDNGYLKIGSCVDDSNTILVPIEIQGIEMWIKNDNDYEKLLNKTKEWEEKNANFIKELSDNEGANTPSYYVKTGNQSFAKQKSGFNNEFDFSDDDCEDLENHESAVDFDKLLKMQRKKKL